MTAAGEKSFYPELWLLDDGRASVQNIHTEKMADDLKQPEPGPNIWGWYFIYIFMKQRSDSRIESTSTPRIGGWVGNRVPSHSFYWDFPLLSYKPCSYGGTPIYGKPHFTTEIVFFSSSTATWNFRILRIPCWEGWCSKYQSMATTMGIFANMDYFNQTNMG